jgi:hypothetical protein
VVVGWKGGGGHGHALDGEQRHGTRRSERTGKSVGMVGGSGWIISRIKRGQCLGWARKGRNGLS